MIQNSVFVRWIAILSLGLCASQAQAGLRLLWGPSLTFEKSQEQVTNAKGSTQYTVGYNLGQLALDLQWVREETQLTGGGNLSVATQREELMLWGKYFSAGIDEKSLRVFGMLGAGQSRYQVSAKIDKSALNAGSEPQWQGGVGIGCEWRPSKMDFVLTPSLGYIFSADRNPSPSPFTSLQLGLSF